MAIIKSPTLWQAGRLQTAHFVTLIVCLWLTPWPMASASAREAGSDLVVAAARKMSKNRFQLSAIKIEGVQRIEPETVRSYLLIQPGDAWDDELVDRSAKALLATGLFADVSLSRVGNTLVVKVVENPIINRIAFVGNNKIHEKDLAAKLQLRPRVVYTRTRVQNDVRRILDLYRRHGRFGATVEPKLTELLENRVDLAFEINEGEFTGVRSVNFVSNYKYSGDILRGLIRTKESRWYRSPSTYDPDKVTYDRELLRTFYLNEGYADFRVISAVAELTPDRGGFIITFTLDEGERYRFGKVDVDIKLKDLPAEAVLPLLAVSSGDWYNAEAVEKSISVLTGALGNFGYAFVEVKLLIIRNREGHTVDIAFEVQEGPQVYVERIDIVGNVRTLDKVIRREFQLVEGDAFNTTKMQSSQQRIKNLGFFRKVEVTNSQGSAPDRTVVTAEVEEQSTGSFEFGIDFVIDKGPLAFATLQELSFLGRGQSAIAHTEFSRKGTKAEISFTEPYLADQHIRGKWGLQLKTGSSSDWKTLVTGFQFTLWAGVLVFPMPVVLLLLLRGAYRSYVWSDDEGRRRREFTKTMNACKVTIVLQVTYFVIANAIRALDLGVIKFVNG
jgi:outer membrane protein insertion porin family